ncbi:MAG: M14 family metallopeptidase [Pseudomonadota bacterium]
MSDSEIFAESYAGARVKFIEACRALSVTAASHAHPLPGPDGGPLTMEVARLGPAGCSRVLVVCSGTHGVEGFCGSAAQVACLRSRPSLPEDCAVVLVHALNPHGFAWQRRVNEESIDLNRNFIDFSRPLPANPGYDELADAICPASLEAEAFAAAQNRLDAYGARHGYQALIAAMISGQYSHPQGLFYGGTAPAWSNRTFRGVLDEQLKGARRVAYLDLHTGYGAKGEIEPLGSHPAESAAHRRLEAWLGRPTQPSGNPADGFPDTSGDTVQALFDTLGEGAELTAACIEFGTESEEVVFDALRRENWLFHQGPKDTDLAQAIRAELLDAFAPPERWWRQAVEEQAVPLLDGVLRGLASPLEGN